MPYCDLCGTNIGPTDRFCSRCGRSQDGTTPPRGGSDFLSSISDRTMRILCYVPVMGWIACVIGLASDRFRRDASTRFHAFQGLYLFVAWLFIDWVVSPMFGFSGRAVHRLLTGCLQLAVIAGWITMLMKTSNNEDYHLPIVGDLAQKSAHEQRP